MYKIIKKNNTLLPYLTASDYNVYILVLTQIVILITGSSCASESHWHKKKYLSKLSQPQNHGERGAGENYSTTLGSGQ